MGKDFSNAPLTVDGVTVNPTWAWSTEYRASVAAELRHATKGDLSPEETEHRYVEWYADKHGLSLKQARLRINKKKVGFS